ERDALDGPAPIEILARVAAQIGEPDHGIAPLQKLLSTPGNGGVAANAPPTLCRNSPGPRAMAHWLKTCRSLPRCSGSIRCSIPCAMTRASGNSSPRPRRSSSRLANETSVALIGSAIILLNPQQAELFLRSDSHRAT